MYVTEIIGKTFVARRRVRIPADETLAVCLSLGLEGDGNIKNDESSIHIDNGLRVGDDNGGTKQVGLRTACARDNCRVETSYARGGAQPEA
jgi:hypothetical protein